jgi:hypothetical protein
LLPNHGLLQETSLACLLADTSQAYLLLLDVFKQFLPRSIWGFGSVIKSITSIFFLWVFFFYLFILFYFIYLFEYLYFVNGGAKMSFFLINKKYLK